MRARGVALIVLAALMMSFTRQEEVFKSTEGNFSVWLPAKPSYSKLPQQTVLGELDLHLFQIDGKEYWIGVSYADYPEDYVNKTAAEDILTGVKGGVAKGMKGKLVRETKITLGKWPGYEIELEGDTWRSRLHIYLAGRRLFQFGAMYLVGKEDWDQTKKVFDSFALLKAD